MSLFKKNPKEKDPVNVDKKRAQEIYAMFAEGLNETTMFIEHEVPFEESKIVRAEVDRLEKETLSRVMGTYIITEAAPAVYDENNKLIQEAIPLVCYEASTRSDLEKVLLSELLDIKTLIEDVIKYYPTYNEKRTWSEFMENFQEE